MKKINGLAFFASVIDNGIEIPQTDGCFRCDEAYAEPEDFICPNCSAEMSEEEFHEEVKYFMEKVKEVEDRG